MSRFRIAAAQIQHETNAFSSVRTDLAAFERSGIRHSDGIAAAERATNSAFGGFLQAADELEVDLVPIVSVWCTPSGMVMREAFETLSGMLLDGLMQGPFDGVVLALHGAMVCEVDRDGDGLLLEMVREAIGLDVPLVATLDLHANISPRMLAAADCLIGYRTYPHIDMADRAIEALHLCVRLLREGIKPTAALVKPPMLPTSQRMTTDRPPMALLMAQAELVAEDPRVLNVTVAGGFPPADVSAAGLSLVVTTIDDPQFASDHAEELAQLAWEQREGFLGGVDSFEEAAAYIESLLTGPALDRPVLIVDIGDNPWTGGPGDSAELVRFFLQQGYKDAAVAIVFDPETVEAAVKAGVGAELAGALGGKTDDLHGPPLLARVRVDSLTDGCYVNSGPMMTGLTVDLGPTAVLSISDPPVRVVVTSRAETPIDPAVFTSNGIDLGTCRILGLKGKGHFRAAFEPVVSKVILVEGPGITGADLSRLPFQHIRRPIWPLDPGIEYP